MEDYTNMEECLKRLEDSADWRAQLMQDLEQGGAQPFIDGFPAEGPVRREAIRTVARALHERVQATTVEGWDVAELEARFAGLRRLVGAFGDDLVPYLSSKEMEPRSIELRTLLGLLFRLAPSRARAQPAPGSATWNGALERAQEYARKFENHFVMTMGFFASHSSKEVRRCLVRWVDDVLNGNCFRASARFRRMTLVAPVEGLEGGRPWVELGPADRSWRDYRLVRPLSSPSLLLGLGGALVKIATNFSEMPKATSQFDLEYALAQPRSLRLEEEERWNALESDVVQRRRVLQARYLQWSPEEQRAGTHGTMMLQATRCLELGHVEELRVLDKLRKMQPSDEVRREIFARATLLEDPESVETTLRFVCLVLRVLARDVRTRPLATRVYPTFLLEVPMAMLRHLTPLKWEGKAAWACEELQRKCVQALARLAGASDCIANVQVRGEAVYLLHMWTQEGSPLERAEKGHLYDDPKVATLLHENLLRFARTSLRPGGGSEGSLLTRLALRGLLAFLWDRPAFKVRRETAGVGEFGAIVAGWCPDVASHLGEALEYVRAGFRHQRGTRVLPESDFAQIRVRSKLLLLNFQAFLYMCISASTEHPGVLGQASEELAELTWVVLTELTDDAKCVELAYPYCATMGLSPKRLMWCVTQLCLNLRDADFLANLVGCAKPAHRVALDATERIVRERLGVSPVFADSFTSFAASVRRGMERAFEAPASFRDALHGTLMKNPVTLPLSNDVVDMRTVERICGSSRDPSFSMAQVTKVESLQARLQQFWSVLSVEMDN